MIRPYKFKKPDLLDTAAESKVTYFVGNEVEKSKAYGMRTLFVVGVQPIDEIITHAKNAKCSHIYLGANQSFQPINEFFEIDLSGWLDLIDGLLFEKYLVTLDFDVMFAKHVNSTRFTDNDNFIPMISVKIPNVANFIENGIVKIDDSGFGATNIGVWCHPVNSLIDNENLTVWNLYESDVIIDSLTGDEVISVITDPNDTVAKTIVDSIVDLLGADVDQEQVEKITSKISKALADSKQNTKEDQIMNVIDSAGERFKKLEKSMSRPYKQRSLVAKSVE